MNEWHHLSSGDPKPLAIAFLVRCWREGDGWRVQMENVATRERQSFATVAAFLEALERMLDAGDKKVRG